MQNHLTTLLPRNLLASGLGNVLALRGRGGRCRLRHVARSWGRCLSVVVGLEGGGPQLLEHATHPLEAGRPVCRPLWPRLLLVQVISIGGGPGAGQARRRRLQVLGRPPRLVTAVPPPSLGGDQRLVVLQQVVVLLPQVLVVSRPEQGGLGDDWWVEFGSMHVMVIMIKRSYKPLQPLGNIFQLQGGVIVVDVLVIVLVQNSALGSVFILVFSVL